ncbi:microtubule-associated protein RP/EB family member 1-like [Teleopsis dalmanni]|uniref:microtubule-associated protein RP/EB family member 1-like n=1 Tax=Teleopsis dalmanni TaxID=139649 RepID=UPI0018CF4A22|nr:microtubule-associated protein RP/EB family member 1-like [Teleopsis dalmanni]XP_037940600.1 microtubule-associated protein RP/EB family member 1-like [Teleopsis dalmanni]
MAVQKSDSERYLDDLTHKESPKQLLNWINKTLETKFSRIEELCTGAAYCQLMDILYPEIIDLSKIHFYTNTKLHSRKNFEALEMAFEILNINKHIPIKELIKFEFMPNIEFLVWFKAYFDYNFMAHKIRYPAKLVRYFKPLGYGSPSDTDLVELMWKEDEKDVAPRSYLQEKLFQKETRNEIKERMELEIENLKKGEVYLTRLKNERDFYYRKLKKIEAVCKQSGEFGKFGIQVKNILRANLKSD